MSERLPSLLAGLVQREQKKEFELAEATSYSCTDNEYQDKIDQANADKAAREVLPSLRALPGRDY